MPNTIFWRGFDFVLEGNDLNVVKPFFYEHQAYNGKFDEEILISAIVDYFDFANRDMNQFPIEENERKLIEDNFSSEEIKEHFPQITEKGEYK